MKKIWIAVLPALFAVGFFAARRLIPGRPVALRELWTNRDAWIGRKVEVSGTLEAFSRGTPDEHYVLEQDGFRVGLLGAQPAQLAPRVGTKVDAEGRFGFSDKVGGYVRVAKLKAP